VCFDDRFAGPLLEVKVVEWADEAEEIMLPVVPAAKIRLPLLGVLILGCMRTLPREVEEGGVVVAVAVVVAKWGRPPMFFPEPDITMLGNEDTEAARLILFTCEAVLWARIEEPWRSIPP